METADGGTVAGSPAGESTDPADADAGGGAMHETPLVTGRNGLVLGILVLTLGYAVLALGYPMGHVWRPGPAMVPLVTAVLASLLLVADLWMGEPDKPEQHLIDDEELPAEMADASWVASVQFAAWLVGYVVLLQMTGHLVASGVVLFATLFLCRARPVWQMALFSVGLSGASFVLFDTLLNVPLPSIGLF